VNACKYSANHLAKVSLAASDKQSLITVEDNGIGILKDNLATISAVLPA